MTEIPTSMKCIDHVFAIDPSNEEAVNLLLKLATCMNDVLQRRDWKIKNLIESDNPKILGVNKCNGHVVKIRLRNLKGGFRTWDQIIGTAMHEIAHIKINSHSNVEFEPLIKTLRSELLEMHK